MGLYGLLVCVGLCFPGKIAEAQKRERETKTTQKASRYEACHFCGMMMNLNMNVCSARSKQNVCDNRVLLMINNIITHFIFSRSM